MTYLGFPVMGLMALGGVLAVMKLRSNKTSTRPANKDPIKTKKKTRFKFKQPKFSGKGLMPAISGLKGGRRK
jgi:hypothetical protein